MRRFLKSFRHGEMGFTLFELLVVVAILGMIAAVAVPNVARFVTNGTLKAANTEALNVKSAAIAYYGAHGADSWPATSAELGAYLAGTIQATYTFDSNGSISIADPGGWGASITWDAPSQTWERN
jgi:type IV pilus assembly protein PilA